MGSSLQLMILIILSVFFFFFLILAFEFRLLNFCFCIFIFIFDVEIDWQDIFEIGCLRVCLIGIDCDVECLESCIARQFFSRGLLLFLNLYCKNLDC